MIRAPPTTCTDTGEHVVTTEKCPTCGLPWPNFCPQDGTRLQGPRTCPNASSSKEKALDATAPLKSIPSDQTSPMDQLDRRSVADEAARRAADAKRAEQAARAALRPRVDDLAKTVLETPAVRADVDDFMRARAAKAAVAVEPKRASAAPEVAGRAAGSAAQKAPVVAPTAPRAAPPSAAPPRREPPRVADDVKTVMDMRALAVDAPPPGKKRTRPERSPVRKKLSGGQLDAIADATKAEATQARKASHTGRTKMEVSRVTPPEDNKTKTPGPAAPSGPPAGVEVAAPGRTLKPFKKADKEQPKSAGRSKEFSETQWFMKGVEVDADLLETVDTEEYDRDESIAENERRKFTLRRDDEG